MCRQLACKIQINCISTFMHEKKINWNLFESVSYKVRGGLDKAFQCVCSRIVQQSVNDWQTHNGWSGRRCFASQLVTSKWSLAPSSLLLLFLKRNEIKRRKPTNQTGTSNLKGNNLVTKQNDDLKWFFLSVLQRDIPFAEVVLLNCDRRSSMLSV